MAVILRINVPKSVDYDSLVEHFQQALENTGLLEEDYVGISEEYKEVDSCVSFSEAILLRIPELHLWS